MNEEQETIVLAKWLELNSYKFSHLANEIWIWWYLWMKIWVKKKKMGVKKWLPDFLIILKRNSLLFVELKRKKKSLSKVSKEQKERIKALNNINNVEAVICYGAENAINLIKEYESK